MREYIKDENSGKPVGVFYHGEQVREDSVYLGYYINARSVFKNTKCAMLDSEVPTSMDKFELRFNKNKYGLWIT